MTLKNCVLHFNLLVAFVGALTGTLIGFGLIDPPPDAVVASLAVLAFSLVVGDRSARELYDTDRDFGR